MTFKFYLLILFFHIILYGLVIWFFANQIDVQETKIVCMGIMLIGFSMSVISIAVDYLKIKRNENDFRKG